MKKTLTSARRLAVLCTLLAAQCAVLAPAHADILTFDAVAPVALLGGESFLDADYRFTALEGPVTAQLGLQSGTGAVLDPNDPGTCDTAACPSGAGSHFYAGLNDGGMQLSRADGRSFSLASFDFAFLAPLPSTGDLLGQLLLTGVRSGGDSLALALDFAGRDAYGSFMFSGASLGAWSGMQFSSVAFSACVFSDGACVNSFDLPAYNEAQFALDNIGVNVSAVPEPSVMWLMAAGLGMLAWVCRRAAAVRRVAMVRGALAATLLLAGGLQGAQAHLLTFTGDTTGGPTYQRLDESGMYPEPWRGAVAYRVYDVLLSEDAFKINFLTTCDFDCGMFIYEGSFDPVNPSQHFLGGDDNYVGFKTAGLGGGLGAGHYAMVVTGNAAADFGFFSTTISSTGAFEVTALAAPVPELSTWLFMAAGLSLLLLAARARTPRQAPASKRPGMARAAVVVRHAVAASFLLAGASQPALADVVTVTGDTTWGPTFHRPGRDGGAPSDTFGLDVAYSAYNLSVSFTDWQHQSIITACDFDCAIFLYRGAFDPLQPMANIMGGSAEGDGRPALEVWLDVGQNYVLVVAGIYDFDWGAFSTTIGSGGGIDISPVTGVNVLDGVSAVPEPSVWLLMLGGVGILGLVARGRRNGAAALS
jgi:hypothetical protein